MHELAMIENILKIVEQLAHEKNLKLISKINLQIGALRQVVPEFLNFAFQAASSGTVAEGAELKVSILPIKVHCNNCQKDFTVDELIYFCPECESSNVKVISGKEMVIESIEGEPR